MVQKIMLIGVLTTSMAWGQPAMTPNKNVKKSLSQRLKDRAQQHVEVKALTIGATVVGVALLSFAGGYWVPKSNGAKPPENNDASEQIMRERDVAKNECSFLREQLAELQKAQRVPVYTTDTAIETDAAADAPTQPQHEPLTAATSAQGDTQKQNVEALVRERDAALQERDALQVQIKRSLQLEEVLQQRETLSMAYETLSSERKQTKDGRDALSAKLTYLSDGLTYLREQFAIQVAAAKETENNLHKQLTQKEDALQKANETIRALQEAPSRADASIETDVPTELASSAASASQPGPSAPASVAYGAPPPPPPPPPVGALKISDPLQALKGKKKATASSTQTGAMAADSSRATPSTQVPNQKNDLVDDLKKALEKRNVRLEQAAAKAGQSDAAAQGPTQAPPQETNNLQGALKTGLTKRRQAMTEVRLGEVGSTK